ncbi:MAG: gliding motility-associated C-terminal domain-containing protein [Spirosomataceae bacterium]
MMRRLLILLLCWGIATSSFAQTNLTIGVSPRRCTPNQNCGGDSTAFSVLNVNVKDIKSYDWNFGEPTSGKNNTSTKAAPKHLYQTPSTYTVRLNITLNDGTKLTKDTTFQVYTISIAPNFGREDTLICDSERGKVLLDPYKLAGQEPKGVKYSWYPYGDTTRVVRVDSSGCYSVTVTDTLTGCSLSAKMNVKICGENPPPPISKWYFGDKAGIQFQGSQATVLTDGKLSTLEGTSAFSDKKGKLQFYTDGLVIYDRDGNLMKFKGAPQDTTKLGGSKKSTQSVLIVQQPGCKSCEFIYYVFTTTEINDSTKLLSYSVVDMRLNKGKGEIVERNIPIATQTTERITSAKNPRDSTYWVVSHDFKNNIFRVSHLTKQGLSPAKTYPLGLPHDANTAGEGQMKISPDGKKIAVVVPGPPKNYVEIFNFNDSTGAITGPALRLDLGPAPPSAYGLEFSPDGSKVYVSMKGDTAKKASSLLLQYDLSLQDSLFVARSRTVIDSSATEIFGSLQYAPDNKIYLAKQGSKTLGVINQPNGNTKSAVNYNSSGFDLAGRLSELGLPNLVQNDIQQSSGPGISASDTCFGDKTQLQAGPWCQERNEKYRWKYEYNGPTQFSGPTARIQMLAAVASTSWDTPLSKSLSQTSHQYPRPGTYQVALYIQNDCKDTLIIQSVTIKPNPRANLGPDISECKNSVTLNSGNNVAGAEYFWFRNNVILPNLTPQISVSTSGTYVVVAAIEECFALDTVKVTLTKPNPINIGRDTTLCQGNTLTLNAGTGWAKYQWNTGATTQQIPVNQPGVFVVNVNDNKGCTNADTINITVRPRPTWQAAIKAVSACGQSDGAIDVTGITPTDTYTYTWFKDGTLLAGQTGASLRNLDVGNYSLRLRGTASCDTVATFSVNAQNSATQIISATGQAVCTDPTNGQITVTLQNTASSQKTYTLRLPTSPNPVKTGTIPAGFNPTIVITNLPVGDYTLEILDANGCKTTKAVSVILAPAQLVSFAPTQTICEGDKLVLDAGNKGDNFLWSTGDKTATITVTRADIYRVTVTDTKSGCQQTAQTQVIVNPKPTINPGPAESICANATPLSLSGATPTGGTWSGSGVSTSGVFTPNQALTGTVLLTYKVTQNNCSNQATRTINVLAAPFIDLGNAKVFCENKPINLSAPELPGATYRWSTGATNSSIQPALSGTYSVTVTLGTCRGSDTVSVTVQPLPRVSLRPEIPICIVENASTVLDAGSGTGYLYRWSTGEQTQKITVSNVGTYKVTVTNPEGCSTDGQSSIIDRCEPRVFVPEVFTPNEDGHNDAMDVFAAHITDFDLKIYNRWGEVVFATNDINEKWDGKYKGDYFPTQSYAWVITYKSLYYPERPAAVKRGAIIVVR